MWQDHKVHSHLIYSFSHFPGEADSQVAVSLCVHSPALDLLPTGLVLELQTAFWVWSHLAFLLIEFLTYFFYPMNRIYHFTYMYFLSPSFSLSPSLFLTHTHTHTPQSLGILETAEKGRTGSLGFSPGSLELSAVVKCCISVSPSRLSTLSQERPQSS